VRQRRVEHRFVTLQIALEQGSRERVLVVEVVEETVPGDRRGGVDLVDRRRAESLGEHRLLGDLEETLARVAALAPPRHARFRCTAGPVDGGRG
jgi:hypothetical protein